MSKRYDFGRLFFPESHEDSLSDVILFQPLGNHVSNVRFLVNKWQFPKVSKLSRKRISKSAGLHDIGKPQKFSIKVDFKKGKPQLTYSFSGHRFLAECPNDPWVEKLARGHHDYSVHDICRDTYILKNLINGLDENNPLFKVASSYYQDLSVDSLIYAQELYILEMCDQIEAEIACRFYEDDDQAESRAFMDFNITSDSDNKNIFYIEPWIFEEDKIKLTLATWSMNIPQELKDKIQNSSEEDKQKLTQDLQSSIKNWWKSQPKKLRAKTNKVILKPLLSERLEKFNATQLYQKLKGFTPNPMQEKLINALNPEINPSPSCLLKAPTGSGKLEAILIPSLAYDYKLILVLPTKSLLEDHRQRIDSYLLKFSELPSNQDRDISLVIDTGTKMTRYIYKNGSMRLPENTPRRHLYKGNIILTTLDKFMYRYFSFGDKQKSFIFPYRIHQDNTLICFDEAHSYDDISFTNFCSLIKALYEAGRSLILMTATLSHKHLERFDYLQDDLIDYIDDADNLQKLYKFSQQILKQQFVNQKHFEWIQDVEHNSESPETFHNAFTQRVLNEWQSNSNQRIIATVETVKDAVVIYEKIKSILETNKDSQGRFLFLYHGRISDIPKDSEFSRTNIYQQIKARDEKNQPYILVTTSAIEVGCDLNSTKLITQFCNPENLIQRGGRCNRKGDIKGAKIIVIGKNIPEFANTLSEFELKNYQLVLQNLNNKNFDTKTIMNCVSSKQQVDDYRVVELFSMLHDYVYNADLTCQPSHEKGLVITRSWTPSVTLVYDNGKNRDKMNEMPQITVPINRLVIKKNKETDESNEYNNIDVYEYIYNKEETRWKLEPLKYWGQAYKKDIVIIIKEEHKEASYGTSQPYEYDPELGFVKLPGVFIKWKSIDNEERLQYKTSENKSVVITYIKPLSNN